MATSRATCHTNSNATGSTDLSKRAGQFWQRKLRLLVTVLLGMVITTIPSRVGCAQGEPLRTAATGGMGPAASRTVATRGMGPAAFGRLCYKGHGPAAFRKLDASSFWQRARNALHDHRDTPQTIRDQYPVRFAGCSISAADDVCSSSASSGAHHTVVTVVVARICHRQTASLPGASRRELCLQWRCDRSYGALHIMDTAPRPCEKRAQCR